MEKTKVIKTREEVIAQMVESLSSGDCSNELVEMAANYVLWNLLRENITITRITEYGHERRGDFEVETF